MAEKDNLGPWVKLYYSIFRERWFQSLSCSQRGFFLQLVILSVGATEKSGKNPVLFFRGASQLASFLNCDGKTAGKSLGLFLQMNKISVENTPDGLIAVSVLKYHRYQKDMLENRYVDESEKSGKNPGLVDVRIEQNRIEQNRINTEVAFATWLMEKWNGITGLPEIKTINPKRLSEVKARIQDLGDEHTEKWWLDTLQYLADCDFFHGNNSRGWKLPGIDWFLKKSNFVKIWERVYESGNKKADVGSGDYGPGGVR